jgi:hypothetical protein
MQVEQPRTSALTAANSLIMFIPRSTSVQQADDDEAFGPDIAGVEATPRGSCEISGRECPPGSALVRALVQLVAVGEITLADMSDQRREPDMLQLLSYVWCMNRNQPNRFIHTALLAFKSGFITLHCRPDSAVVSLSHAYSQYEFLVRYVYDVYYPRGATSTGQRLEFTNLKPIQSLPDELKTNTVATLLKPNFRYTVRGDDEPTEYFISDLFSGWGFGQQSYVGLGAKTTTGGRSPQIIVLKANCREGAYPFKEEDIIRKIHRDGYLPGVPRICEDISERPFVLPRFHAQDPVREARMISLATTGESLSMCKDVLQFLKAMYDLTEGVHLICIIYTDANIT